jgi:hypothetical protein
MREALGPRSGLRTAMRHVRWRWMLLAACSALCGVLWVESWDVDTQERCGGTCWGPRSYAGRLVFMCWPREHWDPEAGQRVPTGKAGGFALKVERSPTQLMIVAVPYWAVAALLGLIWCGVIWKVCLRRIKGTHR